MSQKANGSVGKLDRMARLILAAVLIGFALFCPFAKSLGPLVVWPSGIIGAVFLVTAAVGKCPLYRVLGFHT